MKTPFQELEFGKIQQIISEYCSSSLGKKFILNLKPLSVIAEITERSATIWDTVNYIRQGNHIDLTGLADTEKLFDRFQHHDPFLIPEILLFAKNIQIANQLKQKSSFNDENFPKLFALVKKIHLHSDLENKFSRTFDIKSEIKNSASKELARIRKERKSQKSRIIEKLEKILNTKQYRTITFDNVITKRDNRYVIPIKSGSINTLKGVTHGSSHSGASVYIEPLVVVETNNKIIELYDREKEEIYRILLSLFNELRESQSDLLENLTILQKMDFFKATAQYFVDVNGTVPEVKEEPVLFFQEAKHPILFSALKDEQEIVPFTLELGKDYRSLIISGVNTGGKTVTLKAVGLLTIMALCGLLVTAKKAKIGFFTSFFTDINDEQSLEDSISTFSSHIKKITNILSHADERSLILIDELGTGTNPEEGSAFAQAVIEELMNLKSKMIITTHLNKLKIFATEHAQCENASMRFDEKKMKPMYILDVGFPGNSYALDIAQKYNISPKILGRAREIIDDKSLQLGYLLKKTEKQRNLLEQKIFDYDQKNKILDQKMNSILQKEKDWDKIEKKRKKILLDQTEENLAHLYSELEDEFKKIKSRAKTLPKIEKDSLKNLRNVINKQQQKIGLEKDEISDLRLVPIKKHVVGKKVYHKHLDIVGKIQNISKNSITIIADGLIFSCKANDIYEVPKHREKNADQMAPQVTITSDVTHEIPFELNIMGLTFDEAQPQVDKYIDQAILLDYSRIRILHGKGSGQLREKVRFHLKSDPRLKDFYPAPRAEGGNGVTILEL